MDTPFTAAKCLHKLLDETSPDRQLLPTILQLKELLSVLQFKIGTSGFVDSIAVWDRIFTSDEIGLQTLFPVKEFLLPGQESEPELLSSNNQEQSENPSGSAEVQMIGNNRQVEQRLQEQSISNPMASETLLEKLSLSTLGISDLVSGIWNATKPPDDHTPRVAPFTSMAQYPPTEAVSKLLQAMSEMHRIGQVTFTVIQTPSSTAIWTIAFIRWCIGVEPYIRRRHGEQLVLKQPRSRVLVEIGELDATDFEVRTYRKFNGIEELLWESRSMTASITTKNKNSAITAKSWVGMMKIKTYFNIKLRKMQTRYRIFRLPNTLLFLASKVDEYFPKCQRPEAPSVGPSISSNSIVSLIGNYFDIDKPWAEIEKQDEGEEMHFWSKYTSTDAADKIAELFVEILISSLIENVHHDANPDVYLDINGTNINDGVDIRSNRALSISFHNFLTLGADWTRLKGVDRPTQYRESNFYLDIVTLLVGSSGQDAYKVSTSDAYSAKGQVLYASILDTLLIHPPTVIILPGWLQYEGQRYTYLLGGSGELFQQSKVTKSDFNETPFDFATRPDTYKWMITVGDAEIMAYLDLYNDQSASTNISSLSRDCECLWYLDKCFKTCSALSLWSPDLVYCRSVSAALSDSIQATIRVLDCTGSRVDFLYAQAFVARYARSREAQKRTVFGTVAGNICVCCACQRAGTKVLEADNARGRIKIVILVTRKWTIENVRDRVNGPEINSDQGAKEVEEASE